MVSIPLGWKVIAELPDEARTGADTGSNFVGERTGRFFYLPHASRGQLTILLEIVFGAAFLGLRGRCG